MSRSRKKNPITNWAITSSGEMKYWKTKANRRIRRLNEEIGPNSEYKRLGISKNNIYCSPGDGKTRLDPNDTRNQKYLRK